MNYRPKEPNGWTVEVTYRNGSSPATFTIEELEDIEQHIDLRSDWLAISIKQIRVKTAVGLPIQSRT